MINAINKLTPEQATMQFIYGESIESSGGNPEEAGKFKRVFFLDPFVCGNLLEHAMIFYNIIKGNRIKCYLSNTGTIGANDTKVNLRQSLAIYNDLSRIELRFSSEPDLLGYHYPIKCDRANLSLMNAHSLFPDKEILRKKIKDFLKGRTEYLENFEAKFGTIPEHLKESLPYRENHAYKITENNKAMGIEE
jgi:phosphoenolpyruvate carboxykinase (ATP)